MGALVSDLSTSTSSPALLLRQEWSAVVTGVYSTTVAYSSITEPSLESDNPGNVCIGTRLPGSGLCIARLHRLIEFGRK